MSWLPSPQASPLPEVQGLPQLRLSPKASELSLNAKPTELGPSLAWLSGPPQLGPDCLCCPSHTLPAATPDSVTSARAWRAWWPSGSSQLLLLRGFEGLESLEPIFQMLPISSAFAPRLPCSYFGHNNSNTMRRI